MEGRLGVILALCIYCCLGLDLSLDRDTPAVPGSRTFCGVLTCTEDALTSVTNDSQTGSAAPLSSISSMSVFKTVSGGSTADMNGKRETLIASVTTQKASITRVANGMKVAGSLQTGRATVRVELVKHEDCRSEFTCQVRGMDSQGREVVSKASLVQQAGQGGNPLEGAAVQVLASVQQLITQSTAGLEAKIEQLQKHFIDRSDALENRIEDKIGKLQQNGDDRSVSFENRMEDKIGQLQSTMGNEIGELQKDIRDQSDSFERRIENRLNFLENRIEDKIDNNNNLNKLIQLDVKVSSALADFRSEAKADIVSSLHGLRQEVRHELKQALTNVSSDVQGTLNQTFDLVTSLEKDFDFFKSYGQTNLLTVKNETEKIRKMLMSRENLSYRLWNNTLDLNTQLLNSFKELEANCTVETRVAELESNVSSYIKSIADLIVPDMCRKGMRPYMSQYSSYTKTHPSNYLHVSFLCDTVTDGGGWIVIQRRATGNTDFNRNWAEYRNGFGSFDEDFWLGNDKIQTITSTGTYELRVELEYKGKSAFAHYTSFSIASESDNYKLSLGAYDGTAGDSLSYHDGRMFTTVDKDNDESSSNCAKFNGGGWWFGNCDHSNLNGNWAGESDAGVEWHALTGADSTSFTMMKIRRV